MESPISPTKNKYLFFTSPMSSKYLGEQEEEEVSSENVQRVFVNLNLKKGLDRKKEKKHPSSFELRIYLIIHACIFAISHEQRACLFECGKKTKRKIKKNIASRIE